LIFATNITAFGLQYFIILAACFSKRWPGQEQRASKAVVDQLINDHVETF
jgi:hypothetical protein